MSAATVETVERRVGLRRSGRPGTRAVEAAKLSRHGYYFETTFILVQLLILACIV